MEKTLLWGMYCRTPYIILTARIHLNRHTPILVLDASSTQIITDLHDVSLSLSQLYVRGVCRKRNTHTLSQIFDCDWFLVVITEPSYVEDFGQNPPVCRSICCYTYINLWHKHGGTLRASSARRLFVAFWLAEGVLVTDSPEPCIRETL